ncbi:DUF6000 family protein [Streptomyces sp. SUK 48]|uniref:DUF6000 family protein n=1 Tax=Streptomyces sp. SUK 48 TaxID=2582831 RepID=UPI00129AAB44|nr:DUF6000 family protein [Streptomyces sp. SUK 48]
MPREKYEPFVHALAADAKAVSDAELTALFEGSRRERRTAAWFAAVSRRDHFRERLGALLLESEVCCAGGAYCVAPASFGTVRDADLLAASPSCTPTPSCTAAGPTASSRRAACGGGGSRTRPMCAATTASPATSVAARSGKGAGRLVRSARGAPPPTP